MYLRLFATLGFVAAITCLKKEYFDFSQNEYTLSTCIEEHLLIFDSNHQYFDKIKPLVKFLQKKSWVRHSKVNLCTT